MATALTVEYQGQQCLIRKDQYVDGRAAISLINKHTGKKVAMATIDAKVDAVPVEYVLVKDFGHQQDPFHLLESKGLIEAIGERITNGFLWAQKCQLRF